MQIDERESSIAFELHQDGWICRRHLNGTLRRICWLPYKRRNNGTMLACFGERLVIGAEHGLMTILDLSNA
jgi:hypothetical protein